MRAKGSSSNYLPASCRSRQSPPVLRILPEFWRHFGDGAKSRSVLCALSQELFKSEVSMDFDPRWSDDPRERDDYGLRAEAFAAVGSANRADQIIRKGNARRRHDAGILETFRRSNDHLSS